MTLVELAQAWAQGTVDDATARSQAAQITLSRPTHEDPRNLHDGDRWFQDDGENSMEALQAAVGTSYSLEQLHGFLDVVRESLR